MRLVDRIERLERAPGNIPHECRHSVEMPIREVGSDEVREVLVYPCDCWVCGNPPPVQ